MPAPPPEAGNSNLTTSAFWTIAGGAFVATLKFARDMFRSRKPEAQSLHVSMAAMAVAMVEMRNEVKTLREVVLQSHHERILVMELEHERIMRRLSNLEDELRRR